MKVNIDTSDMLYAEAWNGFKGTDWKEEINVRDFIQHNYTPYEGDESFLAEATPATTALCTWVDSTPFHSIPFHSIHFHSMPSHSRSGLLRANCLYFSRRLDSTVTRV